MERQNAVRSLKRDEKGSVTILFAASAVTLLSLIGMGIDYGRARSMQADLQAGADAAALAAASAMTNSMASRSARADSVFQDNARAHSHVSDVRGQLTSVDNPDYGAVYRYTGSANVETLMLGLINIDELPVNVEAEAIARSSGTEIVIALDTTNSMTWGTKFSDATEMVEDALEAMKAAAGPRDFFVGFVPFTDRVNIGTHRSNWVNVNGMDMSQFEPGDDIPGPGKAKILDDWNGCVEPREERIGSYNWALDDDRPTGSKGWFKPSMKGFYNTPEWREPKCNDEIVGPYRDPDDVMDKIKNLKTDGTGRFDVGLAWAWRMMSRD
jgi:Flp pilus assembly protein TadG